MTFPVEIVMDVVEDVVKCHSVATMVEVPLDLHPEALDAVGVDSRAWGLDEGLRVIDGQVAEEARMQLVAPPLVRDHRAALRDVLPNLRGKNRFAAVRHKLNHRRVCLPFNAAPEPPMGDLRLIHLDRARELWRTPLDVELPFGAAEDGPETFSSVLPDVSLLGTGADAHGQCMQVTHGCHSIHPNLVPLERRGTLVGEDMLACVAAVFPEAILQLAVFPAAGAAAPGATEASLPAF